LFLRRKRERNRHRMKPFKVIGELEKRVRQLAMRLENPPSQGENCSYPYYFQLIKIERSIDVVGKKRLLPAAIPIFYLTNT
jgi:hypothetical protein